MEFGAGLKPDEPIVPNMVNLATLAEDAGFGYIGIFDDLLLVGHRRSDAYIVLPAVAMSTKRVKIRTWATNAFTRHPLTTAYSISSLDELSGGRAFLGFALGGPHAKALAVGKATHQKSEDALKMIRRILAGEKLEVNSWEYQLHEPMPHIPIYWGAQAEKSLRLGARIADGVILGGGLGWVDEPVLRGAVAEIESGAKDAGRNPSDLKIWMNIQVSLSLDREKGIDGVVSYMETLFSYIRADADVRKRFPREMLERKSISGTPEDCIKAIKVVESCGIDAIMMNITGDKHETLQLLKDTVLPAFG
ncbi:MAG: LLM class flavin-dependent oxidoreductase [Nitrososphaerales archaeon]